MYDWLATHHLLGASLLRWLYAALIAFGGYVVVRTALRLLARRLRKLSLRTSNLTLAALAKALDHTSATLVFLLFVCIGLHTIWPSTQVPGGAPGWVTAAGGVGSWLNYLAFLVGGLQLGLWMNAAIEAWTHDRLGNVEARPTNPVVLTMLAWFARIVVWATIVLAVLGNMGMNITAFVASLGIGGVAVALALQNILKDLFASLSIGLDKPFEIGEYIAFGDYQGTVAHVGVKTTRIRSLSGEEVSIGNSDLLANTVRNYSRMRTRRIVFNFSVPIDTSREHAQQIVQMIRDICGGIGNIVLDRAHFKGFGDSSLDFEVVYIVQGPDYTMYMDIQQRINLELMQRLEAIDVHFAVPVQTLRVARPAKPAHPV
jgi:small-conductance mechanosensitive channel